MNNDKLTKDLISKGENEQLEFKIDLEEKSVAKTICSFLNGNGGRIIIGVSDNGKITGVQNIESVEKLENRIRKFIVNNIVPEAPITTSIEFLDKKRILIIKVNAGSKQPYIYDGNIFYRKMDQTYKATSKQISELIHGRQKAEQHWERQLALGIDLKDLDTKCISVTMREAIKNNRTNFSGSDILDFLSHFGLYVNGSFTNACVVLFAKNPSRFIPQIRFRLTEYSISKTDQNLIRDELYEGNLFDIRNKLENYIQNLSTRSLFSDTQWKRKDFVFPVKALQEGIINALIHRDYSTVSSTAAISIYPDKIIISNSGKLPDNLSVSDLKKNHISHPVNPDIAQIVFLRGLIDKLGRGTLKVVDLCKAAGLRTPVWKVTNSEVILTINGPKTLRVKRSDDAVNDAVNDAVKMRIGDAVNDAISDAANDAVSKRLIKELIELTAVDGMSLRELMDVFGVARATMQRDMALLKNYNFVVFEGSPKSGKYRLTNKFGNKLKQ